MNRFYLVFLSLLLIVACSPTDPDIAIETAVAATVGAQAVIPTVTASPMPTATAQPTPPPPTSPPTRTPLPTLTPVPFEALRLEIIALLGESNRGLDKRLAAFIDFERESGTQLRIQWALQEDESIVLMLEQAQMDAAQILQTVYESGMGFDPVILSGTYVLEDAYGNTTEEEVVFASYSAETLGRIQWENFRPVNVFDLATRKFYQTQFQEAAKIIATRTP